MPEIPFHLVDVFASRPLEGNQLCVLADSPGLDESLVARLANEIGFAETTWVLSAAGADYRMRIFTPTTELPFAGHPSLGTAFLLASLGRIETPATQTVPAGAFEIHVDRDAGEARMRQGHPAFGEPLSEPEPVATALGLDPGRLDGPVQTVDTGIAHLIVPLADADAVREARPDGRAVRRLTDGAGAGGVYAFATTGPGRALARFFGPGLGVDEDPATGSAAGPLAAYLAEHRGHTGPLTISQGEQVGRPSTLTAEVLDGAVWVSGGVHVVGRGTFDVPETA